jgi:CheY-like chemotaxis protein
MDGIQASKEIRARLGGGPPIVALTADESPETEGLFRDAGCQEIMPKPMDPDRLYDLLLRYVPEDRRTFTGEAPAPTGFTEADMADFQMTGVDLTFNNICRTKTRDQYLFLLDLYFRDGTQHINDYRNVTRAQIGDYRIWVHALKSASANIGAMDLSAMAREQEEAAKVLDLGVIQQKSPAMFDAYAALLEEVGRVLKANQQAEVHEDKGDLDGEELERKVETALNLLEDFKSKESAKVVENILCYHIPEDLADILRQVKEQLKLYQDDRAEDLLRQAVGTLRV